jgi:cytochrome c-type biogenesis protein
MVEITTLTIIFNLGLLAGISPCLFPVLPSYIAFLANTKTSVFKGFITSILVILGIMSLFMIMGLVTNVISSQILAFFSDNFRTFQLLQGLLLLILGSALVMNFKFFLNKVNIVSGFSQERIQSLKNPYVSSYFIGVFFAAIAAPCALIYFLTLFTIVAGESLANVFFLMIIFSFGAGIPFFIIGTGIPIIQDVFNQDGSVISSKLPKIANTLNNALPKLSGVLILLVGLFLINDSRFFQRVFDSLI